MLAKLFRAYIKNKTSPIKEEKARKWTKILSITYMVVGWNLLTYVMYILLKDRYPKVTDPDRFVKLSNLNEADSVKVTRFEGFKKVEEYTFTNPNAPAKKKAFGQAPERAINY